MYIKKACSNNGTGFFFVISTTILYIVNKCIFLRIIVYQPLNLIVMKSQHLFAALFVLTLILFTSCDPNAIESSSNYWNSNSLVRAQLSGKVKTLTTNNGSNVSSFNEEGFLTSVVYTAEGGTTTTTYNYSSGGELSSMNVSSNMTTPATTYSTLYEYQNIGKFVVEFPFPEHLVMSGLAPNLKSATTNGNYGSIVTYTFDGDKLTILTISTIGIISYRDTAYATYSGQYPVSMTNNGSYAKNITYASNGMFKSLTTGYQGASNETNYYFKSDDKFSLTDSIVSNYGTTRYSQKYTYDSHKNISSIVYSDGSVSNYSYVYDSQGNWTSKTSTMSGTSTGSSTETRTITYW